MLFLLKNPFVIFVFVIFGVAISRGIASQKLLKYLFAACNLTAVLLVLWGGVVWIVGLFDNNVSENEKNQLNQLAAQATNSELIEDTKPNTTGIQNTLNRVNVFLDFSGSVKASDLQSRIQLLQSILSKSKESHFYYFGTCFGGELTDLVTLDVAKIEQYKNQPCNNGRNLKADTDMAGVMQYTAQLLQESANNKTLCLYITDDIQSPKLTDVTLGQNLQPIFEKYAQAGVLFELIRLPSKNTQNRFISNFLANSFNVDEVLEGNDLTQNIERILQNRIVANDLRPAQSANESPQHNDKLKFKIPVVNYRSDGLRYLPLQIRSEYRTMPLIVKIDSISTATWKATFQDQVGKQNYLWINPDTTETVTLPSEVFSEASVPFFNDEGEQTAQIQFQLIYPGSNQLSSASLYDTVHTAYRRIEQFPYNGQLSSSHYVKATLPYQQRIPWWMFWLYALIFGAMSAGIRQALKPTLLGLRVVIKDELSNQQSIHHITESSPTYTHKDEFNRDIFKFYALKILISPLNIWKQPHDRVALVSDVMPFVIGKKAPANKGILTTKNVAKAGNYRVGIR